MSCVSWAVTSTELAYSYEARLVKIGIAKLPMFDGKERSNLPSLVHWCPSDIAGMKTESMT